MGNVPERDSTKRANMPQRERDRERQTDRQTDRQTETDRQMKKKIERYSSQSIKIIYIS